MNTAHLSRRRRGSTLPEVITASGVMLLVTLGVAGLNSFNSLVWRNSTCDFGAQTQAQTAITRIGPFVREARRVVVDQSGSTRLTLQMPARQSNGDLTIPLADGQVISFYASDATGAVGRTGNILWRSVNGTPDTAWSLKNGQGRTLLGAGGIRFTYVNSSDPESVVVSFSTQNSISSTRRQFAASQEIMLRNRSL